MSENIITTFREALPILHNASFSQKLHWLNLATKTLRMILLKSRQPNVNVGIRKQLQTNLVHIKRIGLEIQNFLRVGGSGQQQHSNLRVKWIDVAASFKSRIRTGAVINLTY